MRSLILTRASARRLRGTGSAFLAAAVLLAQAPGARAEGCPDDPEAGAKKQGKFHSESVNG